MNSSGTAAAALRLLLRQVQVLDPLGGLAVAHPGGELVVEVLLAAAHAADVQRGVVADQRGAALHVVADHHGHVRPRRRSRPAPCRPAARPAAIVRVQLGRVLGREEHRQPAVGDLAGQLQVLRPDRGQVDRDVLAYRVQGEPQRLARPVGQRQRVVLAVVGDRLGGPAPAGRSRRTRGCGPAACRTGRRASPRDTCGPDTPRPSRNRPPESVSRVAAVIAVIAGVRAGICRIGAAEVDPLGLRGDPAEHASARPSRTPPRPRPTE